MKRNFAESRRKVLHLVGVRLMQVCVVALGLVLALPARAADERAVKSKVAPTYPEIAKRMRIGGMVQVEATVDADGKVIDAKAVNGNRVLEPAAEDAVRKWKFEPGPGPSKVTVEINFALNQ
jgi:TonB family protein